MRGTNLKSLIIPNDRGGGAFHFEVTESGLTVRNVWTLRLLKIQKDKSGYCRVWATSTDGRRRSFLVHRLVALAHTECPKGYVSLQVNHKDGNKGNNHALNLEWLTHAENRAHATRIGLNKNCGKRTDPERNREIAREFASGNFTAKKLGEKYGISGARVSQVIKLMMQ